MNIKKQINFEDSVEKRYSRPIDTLEEVIWENERRLIYSDYSGKNLFKFPILENYNYTDNLGHETSFESFNLPNEDWMWADDWNIHFNEETDEQGWSYAFNWKNSFSKTSTKMDWVRKRKWKRVRKLKHIKKLTKREYKENVLSQLHLYKDKVYSESEIKMVIKIQENLKLYIMNSKLRKLCKNILKDPQFKESRNRNQVVKEIISSERVYVESLKFLVENYILPLESSAKGTPKINPKEIESMFGNIKIIYNLHCSLYEEMEKTFKEKGFSANIAKVCSVEFPFLKMYIPYLSNYSNSLQTISKLNSNSSFVEWTKKIRQINPKYDLPSLLILPVQRVPRYVLLFKELNKKTDPEHSHYKQIETTVSQISQLAENINIAQREAENCQKMFIIQDNCVTKKLVLIEPHRKYIKDFEIDSKLGNSNLFNKMYLFNDAVLFAECHDKDKFSDFSLFLFTDESRIEEDDLNPLHFNCFFDQSKVIVFCSSENEKTTLFDAMKKHRYDYIHTSLKSSRN